LREFVRGNAWGHHASCTCPIGPRERGGVLTADFRVHGTRALRVVDASVFPRIPGFFVVSAVYMIAEKAADVILADAERPQKGRAAIGEERMPERSRATGLPRVIPRTMDRLRQVAPRLGALQIVPPRHVYRPAHLRREEKENHELVTNPLASPTAPGGAHGFRNRAGSQIPTPRVTNVYLGPFWGDRAFLETFSQAVVQFGYLDPLQELHYGTGSGSHLRPVDGPAPPARSGLVLAASAARRQIQPLLDAGPLQVAPNSLFMLILPDGVTSRFDSDGSESCAAFCGYHDAFGYRGVDVAYAVLPSPTGCQGCG